MSYKPSLICSYSAGQWGGARAAVLLRPALSEMGCIPVSAMIHVPKAAGLRRERQMPRGPRRVGGLLRPRRESARVVGRRGAQPSGRRRPVRRVAGADDDANPAQRATSP